MSCRSFALWGQELQDLDYIGAVLYLPIKIRGNLVGILAVGPKRSGETYSLDDQRTLSTLASQSAVAIENARLYAAERQQAIRDPLTGLFNRRYMEETLERELSRAERKGTPLGIIMLDIDHFKQYNDTFGHEVGDAILCEIGHLLKEQIRREDVACRFGGEEFILILPETTRDLVFGRAEALREDIKNIQIKFRDKLLGTITTSLGVSVFPEHGSTAVALLRAADMALYQSKREGRDRTSFASEE
jgi:diguanylate cyclase (GGDEF)-like protein